MADTPTHRNLPAWRDTVALCSPPTEGAWMVPPLPSLVCSTEEGTNFLIIPISPAAQRLAAAIARTKAELIAATHAPVTDTDALGHLQDACGREEDEDGPYCLQEGSAWCAEHCPFNDLPPSNNGPIAWG